jgi:hypothetical protein
VPVKTEGPLFSHDLPAPGVPAVRALYTEEEVMNIWHPEVFSAAYYILYFLETVHYDKAALSTSSWSGG